MREIQPELEKIKEMYKTPQEQQQKLWNYTKNIK